MPDDREPPSSTPFPERLQPTPTSSAARRTPTPRAAAATRPRWMIATAAILLVAVVAAGAAAAIVLASQSWRGAHASPLARAILRIDLVSGVVPIAADLIAAAALVAVVVVFVRSAPTRPTLLAALIAAMGGAALAIGLVWYLSASDAFGVALDVTTTVWAAATFAAAGVALTMLWRGGAGRRLLAVVAILSFVLAGYLGVNADFGLDRTIADVAGVSTQSTLSLPAVSPSPSPLADSALWAKWQAPAGMPSVGRQAQVVIPNTVSGFVARPAGLYLPPAALTANPPALPLVIMMMGQPGNPDPSFTASVLDRFATQHHGLAPIVLVADQIGSPSVDPLCLDTARHGKAETYLTRDVVDWARTHLHVLQDAAHWTIAGYSNGGECALSLGVKYPQLFGNVLDISGEAYPGSDRAAATIAADFGGSRAAYDAVKPLNEIVGRSYPDTHAIITVGSNDGFYRPQAKAVFAATTAAGWKTTYFEVLNGGHVLGALNGGLQEGYSVLYPILGLAAP